MASQSFKNRGNFFEEQLQSLKIGFLFGTENVCYERRENKVIGVTYFVMYVMCVYLSALGKGIHRKRFCLTITEAGSQNLSPQLVNLVVLFVYLF